MKFLSIYSLIVLLISYIVAITDTKANIVGKLLAVIIYSPLFLLAILTLIGR